MEHIIKTFQDAGLEAKWSKTKAGKPCILTRKKNTKKWWLCNEIMWSQMHKHGIRQGYDNCTLLGDVFSINI